MLKDGKLFKLMTQEDIDKRSIIEKFLDILGKLLIFLGIRKVYILELRPPHIVALYLHPDMHLESQVLNSGAKMAKMENAGNKYLITSNAHRQLLNIMNNADYAQEANGIMQRCSLQELREYFLPFKDNEFDNAKNGSGYYEIIKIYENARLADVYRKLYGKPRRNCDLDSIDFEKRAQESKKSRAWEEGEEESQKLLDEYLKEIEYCLEEEECDLEDAKEYGNSKRSKNPADNLENFGKESDADKFTSAPRFFRAFSDDEDLQELDRVSKDLDAKNEHDTGKKPSTVIDSYEEERAGSDMDINHVR
jgi:hypothetical protein